MDCAIQACGKSGVLLLRTHRLSPSITTAATFQYLARRGSRSQPRKEPRAVQSSKDAHNHALQNRVSGQATSNDGQPSRPPPTSSLPANTDDVANDQFPVHVAESGLLVQRQLEMMNVFLGFEQANRYTITDAHGNHVGYMAEHDGGFGKALSRQAFRTHRPFMTHVFNRDQTEVLRVSCSLLQLRKLVLTATLFYRPFSWINSRIRIYDPLAQASTSHMGGLQSKDLATLPSKESNLEAARHVSNLPLSAMRVIGEVQSEWAPLRRKYNLFLSHNPSHHEDPAHPSDQENFTQFAAIDEPFLSWDFSFKDQSGKPLGSVNRNFAGWGRELFTDMGTYALHMDSAAVAESAENTAKVGVTRSANGKAYSEVVGAEANDNDLTIDQRAAMLATAVTVDFDYFSRHSSQGGMGFMPYWMFGGGGEAAGGVAGAEAGGAVVGGAASEAGGAVVGNAGRAVGGATAGGLGEGAMAGAGTMAGYEAMQRVAGRRGEQQDVPHDAAPVEARDSQGQDGAYGAPSNTQSPQGGGVNEYGDPVDSGVPQDLDEGPPPPDTWGSGDADPWSDTANSAGSDGDEGGSGISDWVSSFFGGD